MTSAQDSTTSEKAYVPYWNEQYAANVSGLWLPTETALRDSEQSSSSMWFANPAERSWFSTKVWEAPRTSWPRTCFTSSTSSPLACTDFAPRERYRKTAKIRVYPDSKQRHLLRKWFGVSRLVFNATVEYLNQPGTKANWKEIKVWLVPSMPEFTKEVPRAVRDGAVKDACLAVKEAKKRYRETGEIQEVSFRKRKFRMQSLFIRNDMIRHGTVYPTYLGDLESAEMLPSNPEDARLVRDHGRWFLCVPYWADRPHAARTKPPLAVGLDPGVRTFLAFYSPVGAGCIGQGDFSRIVRLCQHLDDLLSRLDRGRKTNRVNADQRRRMRKAADRLRWKVRDLIDELHHKAARFLVDHFSVIYLPTFEVSEMVTRAGRKIRKETVRSMLTWAHYRFAQFLKHKAKEHGVQVVEVNEAYTSQTVNWTGDLVRNLGGRKYVRGSDGQVMARDLNGALGVYLKGLAGPPMPH